MLCGVAPPFAVPGRGVASRSQIWFHLVRACAVRLYSFIVRHSLVVWCVTFCTCGRRCPVFLLLLYYILFPSFPSVLSFVRNPPPVRVSVRRAVVFRLCVTQLVRCSARFVVIIYVLMRARSRIFRVFLVCVCVVFVSV